MRKLCLNFHYNGENSYSFVNGKEIIKFTTKDSEIVATPSSVGKISKDFFVDNMRKTDYIDMSMILVLILMLL